MRCCDATKWYDKPCKIKVLQGFLSFSQPAGKPVVHPCQRACCPQRRRTKRIDPASAKPGVRIIYQ
ncbi:unnamed protein product [Mycetohabitans rhizoxinica HKI 454]|uniref:Uncharacterized protein n=1 Tax=Mycetohabitans rhizoxinica (strain DSM 19002 / CIP 109453 / HKI 454) TaxID=882378 RepID=E5AQW4_MYCRK|nr:unnamed protein product [Mycetohabitans rhizoxinica HKI 454]